ncbi:MAG TPA: DUF4293 family protein [Lacibacter sp.]|nr:DUF4293 family protein [Lacibacter sp.]
MIQRIQSLWLLLAATAAILSLQFPFYSGVSGPSTYTPLTGLSNFMILILTVAVALAGLVAIFLYKNRKLQIQLSLSGLLLQLIVLVLYFLETKKFTEGNFALSSILTFIIPVLFILAWMGIRKDEKLIRSMDRLR